MKKFKLILFDLDGTLLPMDLDKFSEAYFRELGSKLASVGYEPKALVGAVWQGIKAMVKNDGKVTNEQAFWNEFAGIYGESALNDRCHFDDFYRHDFGKIRIACGHNPNACELVKKVRKMGYRVALATSPIFPETATRQRMDWAGLDHGDFEFVTTYENSKFCKPNPRYYLEILSKLGVAPEECLMVGNDVGEDVYAGLNAGLSVFLATDCLINKAELDVSGVPSGKLEDVIEYLEK